MLGLGKYLVAEGALENEPKLDLSFRLRGTSVPVDHGYALYSAVSNALGPAGRWLHETDEVALHLVRGTFDGKHVLRLNRISRLTFRVSSSAIPRLITLAGKKLDVDGSALRVGTSTVRALRPTAALYAHVVTTKNGQEGARFDEEVRRQLDSLGIRGTPERQDRCTVNIKGHQIVGHRLLVTDLSEDESVRLQEVGLGGRRKMGCGVFVPRPLYQPPSTVAC